LEGQEQGPDLYGWNCDLKCFLLTLLGAVGSAAMFAVTFDGGGGLLGAADKEGVMGKLADAVKKGGTLEDLLVAFKNITQKDIRNLTPEEVDAGIEQAIACKNSFSPETPVLLAGGPRSPISSLRPGDQVIATDPRTGQTTRKTVTALHISEDTALVDVDVKDAHGQVSTIHTTQNHPIWDDSTKTWVAAGRLQLGHALFTSTGEQATIAAVRPFTDRLMMYNLTVADTHTYYVVAGDVPVLVHNDGGGPTFVDGELFEWTMSTPNGDVKMAAEVRINGSQLTLGDVIVYPADSDTMGRGSLGDMAAVLRELRTKIAPAAAAQGFTSLEITGHRTSGPVGHEVQFKLDLSGYGGC
jgi:hypothetical protein